MNHLSLEARVLISNHYYPALAQDHVDVLTDGIRDVREAAPAL